MEIIFSHLPLTTARRGHRGRRHPCRRSDTGRGCSRLAVGRFLCSYGWRCRREDGLDDLGSIKLALSRDEGRTWSAEDRRILRDDFLNWDIGYPVTIELPDGRLFTAYWGNQMERFYIGGNLYDRW